MPTLAVGPYRMPTLAVGMAPKSHLDIELTNQDTRPPMLIRSDRRVLGNGLGVKKRQNPPTHRVIDGFEGCGLRSTYQPRRIRRC
ncbi:hypothetical protein Pan216_26690 [Planctomycetes bacterium Pan216]|uniref:Uncharacterized protein n=1 Tax=Kolteria novifilia TaxID=2527975 RepID=A0A518B4C2_9BACT|nr:hypothetical protein Pan216_26690 [Planctomycetes bacterium Pan216]